MTLEVEGYKNEKSMGLHPKLKTQFVYLMSMMDATVQENKGLAQKLRAQREETQKLEGQVRKMKGEISYLVGVVASKQESLDSETVSRDKMNK